MTNPIVGRRLDLRERDRSLHSEGDPRRAEASDSLDGLLVRSDMLEEGPERCDLREGNGRSRGKWLQIITSLCHA